MVASGRFKIFLNSRARVNSDTSVATIPLEPSIGLSSMTTSPLSQQRRAATETQQRGRSGEAEVRRWLEGGGEIAGIWPAGTLDRRRGRPAAAAAAAGGESAARRMRRLRWPAAAAAEAQRNPSPRGRSLALIPCKEKEKRILRCYSSHARISSIECKSSHPMASTLVDYARMKSIEPKPEDVTNFQIYPGEGIYGEMSGYNIYVGNKRIAARAGCETVPEVESMKDAVTLGYVFSNAVVVGMFTLYDACRTGAAEAMEELKSLGIKTAMLTGDSAVAAVHAQNQLGNAMEILHAGLLPQDKVRIISELKSEGPTVMVGDGLNDAPALATANVGISMGISGSAVAMETSHITLMSNDIRKIPEAIRLARRTHRKIIVNMLFSVVTKIGVVALAIAGHPILWVAVLADVGTCLAVILNSMLLLQTRSTEVKICPSSDKSEARCCGSSSKGRTNKAACISSSDVTNTLYEPLISVTTNEEHYGEHAKQKKTCCKNNERVGYCRSESNECGSRGICSSSEVCTPNEKSRGCVKSCTKEIQGSSVVVNATNETYEHVISIREKDNCSSSKECTRKTETHSIVACSTSCRKQCEKQ